MDAAGGSPCPLESDRKYVNYFFEGLATRPARGIGSMEELITRVAAAAGLNEELARKAVGIIL
jgi:hypothetical protein